MKKFLILLPALFLFGIILNSCQDQNITEPVKESKKLFSHVEPFLVTDWTAGNSEFECAQACAIIGEELETELECGDGSVKVEGWSSSGNNGTFSAITIYDSDGKTFSWSSLYKVYFVIVKAGTSAYIYYYPNGSLGDTDLVAPEGKDISHTTFCWTYTLDVSKTAVPSYTRTYTWTIEKTGDQTELTLSTGQQFQVNYEVVVDASYQDSDFGVTGVITIENNTPIDFIVTDISDIVDPSIAATVDCGEDLPITIPAGETLQCTYSADLTSSDNTINVVTVTYNREGGSDKTAVDTADVTFGDPTTEVDECIDVTDDQYGDLGTVCYDDLPKTFEYSMNVGPYAECGEFTFVNIASFVTNDTEADGSDDHTVDVTVPCNTGCTLTQGYWKTHSDRGPAPYDDGWSLLGSLEESTVFFSSGKTWYEVFWTAPAGNVYYILAHQYMAAKLNILNGAASTSAVDAAITAAEAFFNAYTPTSNLTKTQKTTLLGYASTLDQYNNGLIGPGHCDE